MSRNESDQMSPANFLSLHALLPASSIPGWLPAPSPPRSPRPGPGAHLHKHVPVHVPGRQEVAGRVERQPTGRRFQSDVFRGVPDPGRDLRGVGVLLVAPLLRGPPLARVIHAPEGSEPPRSRPRCQAPVTGRRRQPSAPLPLGGGTGSPPGRLRDQEEAGLRG